MSNRVVIIIDVQISFPIMWQASNCSWDPGEMTEFRYIVTMCSCMSGG